MPDRLVKDFPVFDCDAHVNDPLEIWEYVPESKRELVARTYRRNDVEAWLNDSTKVIGACDEEFAPMYNPSVIAGPQMDVRIMRKLISMMPLTAEQRDYLRHDGARDPAARLRDLDLMGIDQVLVIPTMVIKNLPFAEDPAGVDAFCEAYNDWCADWCAHEPARLFGAALLPLQDPELACKEVVRTSNKGFPVGLIRPIDARGAYPNDIGAVLAGEADPGPFDRLFRTFEDEGMVLGMHTFPAGTVGRRAGPELMTSPGELVNHAGVDSQTLSFIYEMQVWLVQILLGGVLDRYPNLKMAVFESNSSWLPYVLETCDRLFRLYANERQVKADRLPSEAFAEQCVISFESDELHTMQQWRQFEDIGIWASDAYHHDGADSWSAIRAMRDLAVPEEVQHKLLGGNARRFYGIEPKMFVTDEAPPLQRPDWFPQGEEFQEWQRLVSHPRANAEELEARGISSFPNLPLDDLASSDSVFWRGQLARGRLTRS